MLAVALVGLLLPRDHEASRSATLKASPEAVWAALTDTKAFPAWRGDVRSVEALPSVNGKRAWKESGKNGSISYVAEEETAPSRLVARITNDDLPFGGAWTYDLAPNGSGTRLTITEKGWVSNPIFRFVSRFVIGQTATMDSFLRALGKHFGESVTPA
jgi:uncharacterized protein YndB with AHSA1/START domain